MPAEERLVHVQGPSQLRGAGRAHRHAVAVEPRPRRLVAAQVQHPLESRRGDALLVDGHPPRRPELRGQRDVCVLEGGAERSGHAAPAAGGRRLSKSVRSELNRLWHQGESLSAIARALQVIRPTVSRVLRDGGGIRERPRKRSLRALSLAGREEISRGLVARESIRSVAEQIGRGALDGALGGRQQRGPGSVSGGLGRRHSPAAQDVQARAARLAAASGHPAAAAGLDAAADRLMASPGASGRWH